MKILFLDIETAPNKAYVWGLFDQNINIEWIEAAGYTLCYAAKWYGEDKVYWESVKGKSHRSKAAGKRMLKNLQALLDEADVVVTYNGKKFDIPTVNKEFVLSGFLPPAPYKELDLLPIIRSTFRFPSNKLDYVAQALGLGGKVKHRGPQLWLDCMANKQEAWKEMESYNKHDVVLLEKLYKHILPWIKTHPNWGVFTESDRPACVNCGGSDLQRRGVAVTTTAKYPRYQCKKCGTWNRGTKSELPAEKKRATLRRAV